MIKHLILFATLIVLGTSCHQSDSSLHLRTNFTEWIINDSGQLSGILALNDQVDLLAKDTAAPILSIGVGDQLYIPTTASFDSLKHIIELTFDDHHKLQIQYQVQTSHISLELVGVSGEPTIDFIVWGPFPCLLNDTVGETIGVVRGNNFALGIQALNPKTLGGYPWNDNDCMPQIDIFDQDDLTDLSEEGKAYVLYRVEAAIPTFYGSSFQAYCRNRLKSRIIENWGHEKYQAPAFDDGGIIGSKIALFGCPTAEALETIGKIERTEGLPHPKIDGVWGKESPTASAAYLIMDFGEQDIEKALEITKKSGLSYLYHPGPFLNWGHFELKPSQFPNGYAGMKQCVDIAREQSIMLGVHTLSNFITTNDPYVSPKPDPRLASVGSTVITEAVSDVQIRIPIKDPTFFQQHKNDHLRSTRLGNELIRYAKVSDEAPWHLEDCQRAAFGSKAENHQAGENIFKLADHAYEVFLPNASLSEEMAGNIANLFNETGLRQISFDGLEGMRSTAMGNYGEILFTTHWYSKLSDDIRSHFIADASRTSHYFWHIYSRMNWGEPWYAGFRESQTAYRLKNQAYFKRNYMPAMLGWFSMKPETSVEDIEWMLARSAAFDAGYGFSTNYKVLAENGNTDRILELLGQWEKLRLSGILSRDQKKQMEDTQREFTLRSSDDLNWELCEVYSLVYEHAVHEKQPGEPTYASYDFSNKNEARPLQFIITAKEGSLKSIGLEMDHHKEYIYEVNISEGERIKYNGGDQLYIYDKTWHRLRSIAIDPQIMMVGQGAHQLRFDCESDNEAEVKIELRIEADPIHLQIP